MPRYEQYSGESKQDAQKRIAKNKLEDLDPSELQYKIGDAVSKPYQERLQWLGLYKGKIDGHYGKGTDIGHKAYLEFKKSGYSDKQIFLKIKGGVESHLIESMKKGQ